MRRPALAHALHGLDEELGVAVCDVEADGGDARAGGQDRVELLHVGFRRARRRAHVADDAWILPFELPPLVEGVVLVNGDHAAVVGQFDGHLEGSDRVHVGDHHWHAPPLALRMPKFEGPSKLHL